MEIITGIEPRRRWRLEEKLRIVAETEQPGACFAEIARRYDVSRRQLCLLAEARAMRLHDATRAGAAGEFLRPELGVLRPPRSGQAGRGDWHSFRGILRASDDLLAEISR